MPTRLYVGGIPYRTTEDDLRAAFSEAGEVVSVAIITDRMHNNRSKGFGFVEMASPEAAHAAIERWHGKDFDGRTLTVSEARPREERGGGDQGGGSY